MTTENKNLVMFPGGSGSGGGPPVGGKPPLSPPPGANLSTQGRRVWEYICQSLIDAGVDITTAGVFILMAVHTYIEWSDAMKLCVENGRYGTSKKGVPYEHQHSHNEKRARESLCKMLPDNCLTALSLVEARLKQSKTIGGPQQDDLFGDLVNQATAARPNNLRA